MKLASQKFAEFSLHVAQVELGALQTLLPLPPSAMMAV